MKEQTNVTKSTESINVENAEKKPYRDDYTNQEFGDFVVLEYVGRGSSGAEWKVKCKNCGKTAIYPIKSLKSGATKNCKFCNRNRAEDLTGQKFGRLSVIRRAERTPDINPSDRSARWLCKCDCGNTIIVSAHSLKSGNTRSCGCFGREARHINFRKHGDWKNPLYNVWQHMKDRCNNPNNTDYYNYGGRGIKVCPEWDGPDGYIKFKEDMESGYREGLTLDRIDNNKGYYKENCRWTTNLVQQNNKSTSFTVKYYDREYTIAQLCEKYAPDKESREVAHRLRNGWTLDEALYIPNLNMVGMTKEQYLTTHKIVTSPIEIENKEEDIKLNENIDGRFFKVLDPNS